MTKIRVANEEKIMVGWPRRFAHRAERKPPNRKKIWLELLLRRGLVLWPGFGLLGWPGLCAIRIALPGFFQKGKRKQVGSLIQNV